MSKLEKPFFKTIFGSHLYGSNVAESDTDYKAVALPNGRQIILRDYPSSYSENTKTKETKNSKDDVDMEIFNLYRFLELGKQGQTVFFDMIFSPERFWLEKSDIWYEILANKDKIVNKKVGAAIGYARSQAEKYSAKGIRLQALQEVIAFLNVYKAYPTMELGLALGDEPIKKLSSFVSPESLEFISLHEEFSDHLPGGKLHHLMVCGKKAGFTSSVKTALNTFQKSLGQYGDRAKAAVTDGVDWKAMLHAVRIAKQTKELLDTGHITFPRPEKDLLLKIRHGELSYEEVSEIIEKGIEGIKEAQAKSSLREESDADFINDFVYETYRKQIE